MSDAPPTLPTGNRPSFSYIFLLVGASLPSHPPPISVQSSIYTHPVLCQQTAMFWGRLLMRRPQFFFEICISIFVISSFVSTFFLFLFYFVIKKGKKKKKEKKIYLLFLFVFVSGFCFTSLPPYPPPIRILDIFFRV